MNQLAGYSLINRNFVLSNEGFFDVTKRKGDWQIFLKGAFEKRGLDINQYYGIWGNMELYDKIGKEEFFELVKKRPFKFVYLMGAKFIHHSMGIQMIRDPFRIDRENVIFQLPLVLIFLFGLRKIIKSRNNTIILMGVYLITMFGIRTLSNPAPKNMVGNIPILILLAIWYIIHTNKFLKNTVNE